MKIYDNFRYQLEKYVRAYNMSPAIYKDTFIISASYPKSGSTWLRFIMSNIAVLHSSKNDSIDFHTILEYTPRIVYNRDLRNAKEVDGLPLFLKTHFPYNFRFKKYKSIVVIRKPEDVMLSYYKYLQEEKYKKLPSLSLFLRHWRFGIPAWRNFHEAWLTGTDYIIRYEDLIENPQKVINDLYVHFGYKLDSKLISQALALSSKENMRKALKDRGDPNSINPEFQFVGKGIKGEGRKHLTEKDLEYIQNETEDLLIKYGY